MIALYTSGAQPTAQGPHASLWYFLPVACPQIMIISCSMRALPPLAVFCSIKYTEYYVRPLGDVRRHN